MTKAYIETPLGILALSGNESGLHTAHFTEEEKIPHSGIPSELKEAVSQLMEYFEGKRNSFNLKLDPKGTEFQKKVWAQLQSIPFGKTVSYQQIANHLENPKVIRAAASANGKNPIAIIIPCHRVIGSDGSLTGYAGGLHRKKWLLEHERPTTQTTLFQ
jgi:methylated-DNA-[protein]-cysteine S-methyltransferase